MSEQQATSTERTARHAADTDATIPVTHGAADGTEGGAATATAPPAARVFVYNGQEYPDPDPELTADQVRRELARFVPELTNADVREELRADGTAQFVFSRRLGTKGSTARSIPAAGAPAVLRHTEWAPEEERAGLPNARLVALIGAIPEVRLEIFRLAHELILPNGEFDLDAAAARGEELERAGEEAHRHARATAALRDVLLALPGALMGTLVATRGLAIPSAGRPSRLARASRADACLATRLAGHLLGEDPIGGFAELVRVVFPAPGERDELARRAASHRAREPAPGDEAARVRAFIELVGETRFPVDDVALWDAEAATYRTLLEGVPFIRLGWCYDDLHDEPGAQRPGFALLRALAADPDDGAGIAGRGALLDHLGARGIPRHLLIPLADWGLSAATLEARLAGTRFAAAADFARWIAQDTGLAFLDYADDDGFGEAPWSRRHVAILAEQWPRARALLDGVEALADWLESDPPAHFAQLLGAAGLVPPAPTRGGAP